MTNWHPILATVENTPGHWWMVADLGEPYGEITFVRRGDELGYRADRVDDAGVVIKTVGYFVTLETATVRVHADYIRSHGAPARTSYSA
jgi:hypothetical protein